MALSSLLHKCNNITQEKHILLFKDLFLNAQEELLCHNVLAQWCDPEVERAETQALCSGLFPLLHRMLSFNLISFSHLFSKPSPLTLVSSSSPSSNPADFAEEKSSLGIETQLEENRKNELWHVCGSSVRLKMYAGDPEFLWKRETMLSHFH